MSVDNHVYCLTTHHFTFQYKTYEIKNQQGNDLSFVFSDLMGLERQDKSGVLPDDIISAIKGHIRDGYEVKHTHTHTYMLTCRHTYMHA